MCESVVGTRVSLSVILCDGLSAEAAAIDAEDAKGEDMK